MCWGCPAADCQHVICPKHPVARGDEVTAELCRAVMLHTVCKRCSMDVPLTLQGCCVAHTTCQHTSSSCQYLGAHRWCSLSGRTTQVPPGTPRQLWSPHPQVLTRCRPAPSWRPGIRHQQASGQLGRRANLGRQAHLQMPGCTTGQVDAATTCQP